MQLKKKLGPFPIVVMLSHIVLGKYIAINRNIMTNVMKVHILDTIKLFLLVKYCIQNK